MPPPRPQRDLTAVVNAERPRRVLVPPRIVVPCLAPWSPHTSPSHARESDFSFFFSPPPNLDALTDLLPQQLFSHSPSSSHRCRRRIEGRTVEFHSRRAGSLLRDSRQPAAVLVSQQRVSLEELPRSFSLPFPRSFSPSPRSTSSLSRARERKRALTRASCILLRRDSGTITRVCRASLSSTCVLPFLL